MKLGGRAAIHQVASWEQCQPGQTNSGAWGLCLQAICRVMPYEIHALFWRGPQPVVDKTVGEDQD